ncbi:MAG: transposase [Bacteroidales bacterium]|nr:transposase [Bacteroidales bacterium]
MSTGKLEGINNKIKVIKRKAYGYRDDEFFKLKLLSLHDPIYAFAG